MARRVKESNDEGTNSGTDVAEVMDSVREVMAVNAENTFSDDQVRDLQSFEDLRNLFAGEGVEIGNAADLGDGFAILQNKDKLVDTALIIIDWRFVAGTFGTFVTMRVMTEDGKKYRVNDGSTGVHQQLEEYTGRTGKQRGFYVPSGFVRSDYEYTDGEGEQHGATTYYLSTNAA